MGSFLNPWGLAWLALIIPIVLLYLLRLRRREMTIASVMFWERAIEDLQANAPFQKLRRNLLLFLQILIVCLAALAIARPFVRTTGLGGGTVVAILDGSASMTAPLGNSTRFGRARDEIGKLIGDLRRGDQLMLVLATDRAEVLHPLSGDRKSLSRALAGTRPTASPTNLRDALYLAVSAIRGQPDARVYVFSDGAIQPAENLALDVGEVRLVRIGEPVDNVGITALDVRRAFGEVARAQVLLALAAFGPTPGRREVEVEFRTDGRLFDLRRYDVEPGKPKVVILEDLPASSGLLEVRIVGDDGLAADNVAFVSLGAPRRSEVWVAGRAGMFIEKALTIDPSLRVVKASVATVLAASSEGRLPPGTVVIFAGDAPASELDVPSIYIACGGPGSPVKVLGTVEQPAIVDWSPDHPVTQHVDFGEVSIGTARTCRPRAWATVLVESGETPLVVAGERRGARRVYVGWDFADSDFPLRAGFPIFIANAVSWLSATTAQGFAPAVRCGVPVMLAMETAADRANVTRPDQTSAEVPVTAGRAVIGDTRQVGIYRVRAGSAQRSFAASLLSLEESDLTPRAEVRVGRSRVRAPARESHRQRELWRWLVGFALVLLLLEWWWFHRRG